MLLLFCIIVIAFIYYFLFIDLRHVTKWNTLVLKVRILVTL